MCSLSAIDTYISQFFDLSGQVAVVTGGMGQLGRQYVSTLARAGAKVAIFDIVGSHPKITQLQDLGFPVSAHVVDITDENQVARAFAEVVQMHGTPTILVNNAGIDSPPGSDATSNGPFEDYPEATWDAVLDSHLKGAFVVSKEFLRCLRTTTNLASIINISSIYGVVSPDQSMYEYRRVRGEIFYKPIAYSVAKAGIIGFTKWLAEYAAPLVRVNCLVLGGVKNNQEQQFLTEYESRTILGRMAQEDEYSPAVLFLASHQASSYMTGSIMTVDGGWTAR